MPNALLEPILSPAAAPRDSDLSGLRKDLLRELAGGDDRPGLVFAGRYAATLVPLACAAVVLWAWPGIATAALFTLVAGFTQNALGVLMHEGSHFFFHRDRRTNDALANALVCLPIFNTVAGYRHEHLDHHQGSGGPEDPYYELYGTYHRPQDMIRGLARDLLGISALRAFLRRYSGGGAARPGPVAKRSGGSEALKLVAVQGLIAGGLWLLTGWAFAWIVLWIAPLMTIPLAINRIRTFVEHYPGAGAQAVPANRTTPASLLEYLCVAPYGYSHHYEHHFAPTVPYYRLARAHRYLRQRASSLPPHQYNQAGYLRSFARLMRELASSSARAA